MSTSVVTSARPRIYGHRGCRGLRPENTLPAFLHALDWHVDGLELDVVLSADNEVVVSHEAWLNPAICLGPDGKPLSSESGQEFNLYQHSYAEIRRCDCGRLRHPSFPEQRPEPAYKPLLREVVAAVAAYCAIHRRPLPAFSVELKSSPVTDGLYHPAPASFVTRVLQELDEIFPPAHPRPDILLMSFDHRVVRATRQLTKFPVCLLLEDTKPIGQHLAELGFVPDVLGPSHTLIDDALLSLCTQLELPIVTWTVNDTAAMQALAAKGVAGITTDYPDRAFAVFGT